MIPVILFALTIHEFAHAWVAWKRGDDTALEMGRVSLNPLVHLDLMGTLVMVLTGFIGWAKPVPLNFQKFKKGFYDLALVALAGPMANILSSILFSSILYFMFTYKIELPYSILEPVLEILFKGVAINLVFAILNLIPIPPLDGFNAISVFLPINVVRFCRRYQLVFMFLLILFIWKGPFRHIINYIIEHVLVLILGK
jgi:Zn-dependent protease